MSLDIAPRRVTEPANATIALLPGIALGFVDIRVSGVV